MDDLGKYLARIEAASNLFAQRPLADTLNECLRHRQSNIRL